MNFGWIKRLFIKKVNPNNNTSDMVTIDTSFIRVPKLSKLSKQDRKKVSEYIEEIKVLQAEHPHKLVLKYGSDLLNKSNSEIEFFMINLDEIIKEISSIINNTTQDNYFKLLLSKEEIKQSIDEFYNILNEAKLRLTALDVYIKKEEIRKYDFLGIFGMSERLRYLADKNTLLNERDMLKTTIKIADGHLLAAYKALKEEELLLNEMEKYINSSKSFNTKYCDEGICKRYVRTLLDKKKLYDKGNCSELKQLYEVCYRIYGIDCGMCLSEISDEYYDNLQSNLEYKKLIPFLSKENRTIKKYAYEHRNDYKVILDKIENKIKECENGFLENDEIGKIISECIRLVYNYLVICKKYTNESIVNKLKEALFNLNYHFYIRTNACLTSIYSCRETIAYIFYPDALERKKLNFDTSEEKEYYDKLSYELIEEIEKQYGISFGSTNKKKAIVNALRVHRNLKYLYYFLNTGRNVYNLFVMLNELTGIKVNVREKSIIDESIENNSFTFTKKLTK